MTEFMSYGNEQDEHDGIVIISISIRLLKGVENDRIQSQFMTVPAESGDVSITVIYSLSAALSFAFPDYLYHGKTVQNPPHNTFNCSNC